MAKREANLELGSGDVAGAAGVHAVEPLPEHHRVLHLLPPGSGVGEPARTTTGATLINQLADSPADYEKFQYLGL